MRGSRAAIHSASMSRFNNRAQDFIRLSRLRHLHLHERTTAFDDLLFPGITDSVHVNTILDFELDEFE